MVQALGGVLGAATLGGLSFAAISTRGKAVVAELPTAPRNFGESQHVQKSKESVAHMLAQLQTKSARNKIETAHDAATRTHELGFGTDESAVRAKQSQDGHPRP